MTQQAHSDLFEKCQKSIRIFVFFYQKLHFIIKKAIGGYYTPYI